MTATTSDQAQTIRCKCGTWCALYANEPLPRGWRPVRGRRWRHGYRVYSAWTYVCPPCAQDVRQAELVA